MLFFVANPDAVGALQPLDAHGRWLCQIGVQPEEWVRELWDAERVRRWVRGAVGVPGLDVEVNSVGLWRINATVADRLVQGRAVLCGDAAHQFPPTGGLGVNTGLQGMHNAMWKLALCVRGLAGWSLLKTYEDERREPAITTITQSLQNHRNVARLAAAAYNPAGGGLGAEEILRSPDATAITLASSSARCIARPPSSTTAQSLPTSKTATATTRPVRRRAAGRRIYGWAMNVNRYRRSTYLAPASLCLRVRVGRYGERQRLMLPDSLECPSSAMRSAIPAWPITTTRSSITTRSATTGRSSCVPTGMSPGAAQPGPPMVPRLFKPSNRSWIAACNWVSADSSDESTSGAWALVASCRKCLCKAQYADGPVIGNMADD